MLLSRFFSLAEMTVTTRSDSTDIDGDGDTSEKMPNIPTADHVTQLRFTCEQADKIRYLLNVPMKVTSGYRSEAVNTAIGGNKSSQHMKGEALDFVPVGYPGGAEAAMVAIAEAIDKGTIIVDQVIIYASGFIHVSFRRRGNRNEKLRSEAKHGSGGPYMVWTPPAKKLKRP